MIAPITISSAGTSQVGGGGNRVVSRMNPSTPQAAATARAIVTSNARTRLESLRIIGRSPGALEAGARGGVEDGVGVEAVDAVEVRQIARLAEMLDAERVDAMPRHGAEPGQRRRVAVEHGDERGVLAERRQEALDLALTAAAQLVEPAGMEPVGRGDRQEAGARYVLEQHVEGGERLGRHRPGISDGEVGARLWRLQPVAAGDDVGGEIGGHRPLGLLDGPRREAQIDRAAVLGLKMSEGPAHQHGELVDEARLE